MRMGVSRLPLAGPPPSVINQCNNATQGQYSMIEARDLTQRYGSTRKCPPASVGR